MIPLIIKNSFDRAAKTFDKSLSIIKPYKNKNEGYNEANIVGSFASAFVAEGGCCYFEVPLKHGRIDALLITRSVVFKVEAKQLYNESVSYLEADVKRLTETKSEDLISAYRGDSSRFSVTYDVLLCDCWKEEISKWWLDQPNKLKWNRDFLKPFETDSRSMTAHGEGYFWLLACREQTFRLPSAV